MVRQKYNLNLIPDNRRTTAECSQYDTGIRTLVFKLFRGQSAFNFPEGMTAKIRGSKPDGNVFEYPMEVDRKTGTVSIVINEQMSVVAGTVLCEVVLFDGVTEHDANVIGTANFNLVVEPSPLDMGELSDSDIPAIETLINGGDIGDILSWEETGAQWTKRGTGDMSTDVYDKNKNGIVDDAEKVNGHSVFRDIAADEYSNSEIDNALAGKADLVDGKVRTDQLPSYVDDVVEYASLSDFPATGESGKIYIALDTNNTYRWSGSEYIAISNPIDFDDTPTAGSTNAVTSNGIKVALDGKVNTEQGKGLSTNDYTTAEKNKLGALPTKSELYNTFNSKVDKETGKGLSSNDYTNAEKSKLGALPTADDLSTALAGKVDKETGKGLSTNDYTTEDQTKLSDLPTKAELDTALNGKVDKVTGKGLSTKDYTAEDQAKLSGLPTGSELTEALAGKKNTQTPVTSPTASGNALAFIDSVSQDAQGVLTATKKTVTVDSTPTTGSTNPVQSGAVADALGNLNQAISNKVDKVAGKQLSTEDYSTAEKTKLTALPDAATLNADLASKQDTLTWDATPTEGSNNPVRSGGIYTALDGKLDASELNGVAQDATGLELVAGMELEAVLIDNLFQTVFNSLPSDERCLEIYDELVIGNSYLDLLVTELRKKEAENA